MEEMLHTPVLLQECLHYLSPCSGGVYLDGTVGFGGHSEAILRASAPDGTVLGFDWDGDSLEKAKKRLIPFGKRFRAQRRNFAELALGLREWGISQIDGLLLDVGLSSLQLDLHEGRGFSFQVDEFLDMRMDNRRTITAADILASADEKELADIFFYYGEEKQARPIAAAIVARRDKRPVLKTKDLVGLICGAVPRRFHPKKIHVATRTFQALRIAVNGELENLGKALDDGVGYLRSDATICVISFHSLEDRIVKRRFKDHPQLEVITSRPVTASADELRYNPRSRSARLRVARKQ